MVGSHFTREVLVKLQKGLKFMFLESHNLEVDNITYLLASFLHLNLDDVMEVE